MNRLKKLGLGESLEVKARWILYLSRFDFTLKHIASKSIDRADSLSRRVDCMEGVKRDNENQVMLKKEWLEIRVMKKRQLLIEGAKEKIIEKIKKSKAKDDEVVKVVKEMKKAGVKVLRNKEWQIENNLVLKEGKMHVLRDNKLRLEIIQLYHNMPIAEYKR